MKKLLLLCLLISFQSVAQEEIQEWWFTRNGQKRSCQLAKRNGLRDTLVQISTGSLYLWSPKKYDSSKPNLILIHGMGINGISQWQKQIESFSGFNLFIPDLMGYAESKAINLEYSPEFQVKAIHEAVRKLGVKGKLNVAGFSYGGLVTATFHQLFENEVNKIAICDGPVKYFTPQVADSIVIARKISHFEKLISPKTEHEVEQFFDAIYSGKSPKRTKKIEQNMVKYIFQVNAETKRKQMDYLSENSAKYLTIDYHFNSSSVLFLWGDEDGAIPCSVGQKLKAEYTAANLYLVKGAKHDAHLMFTKEFNATLLKHFK